MYIRTYIVLHAYTLRSDWYIAVSFLTDLTRLLLAGRYALAGHADYPSHVVTYIVPPTVWLCLFYSLFLACRWCHTGNSCAYSEWVHRTHTYVHHSDTVICASHRGGCFASGTVSLVWWMFCCSSKGGVSVRVVCVCVCPCVCVCVSNMSLYGRTWLYHPDVDWLRCV